MLVSINIYHDDVDDDDDDDDDDDKRCYLVSLLHSPRR